MVAANQMLKSNGQNLRSVKGRSKVSNLKVKSNLRTKQVKNRAATMIHLLKVGRNKETRIKTLKVCNQPLRTSNLKSPLDL